MRKMFGVLAVAVLAVVVAVPVLARPQTECVDPAMLNDPVALSQAFRASLDSFVESHPRLPERKLLVIAEGFDLAVPAAFDTGRQPHRWNQRWGAAFEAWVGKVERTFGVAERGEIFTGMGAAQVWLAQAVAPAVPYCNCTPIGSPCGPNGAGRCSTGCYSWTDPDLGIDWVGICVMAQPTEDEVPDNP